MYVTVTMDDRLDPYRPGSPHHLFHLSRETVSKLCKLAGAAGSQIEETWVKENGRFSDNKPMAFLERNCSGQKGSLYRRTAGSPYSGEQKPGPGDGGDSSYDTPPDAGGRIQMPGFRVNHRRYGDLCGPCGKGL